MTIDLTKYGFDNKDSEKFFNVRKLSAYDGQNTELIGSFIGKEVKIDIEVEGRDVILLELKQQS